MTKEMKIARKTMNDLYEMIEKKLDENITSGYSENQCKEFNRLLAQRSAIYAACMILNDNLPSHIALNVAIQMLSL